MAPPSRNPVRPSVSEGRRAFVAFAGGGAKGIAHVGALRALERRRVSVEGYAGTSAGAIVATLAAAGFKARDIIHPTATRSILDELRRFDPDLRTPIDLFGPGGWSQIAVFRTLYRISTPARLIAAGAALGGAALASAVALGVYGFPLAALIIFFWLLLIGVAAGLAATALIGLARLHTLQSAFGQLLSAKLFPHAPDEVVRFKHFDGRERPTLKIVAANLSTRELQLFSSDTTPETPVAEAVAASICLPVIFDLWMLDGHRYVDGGVVSNLPAWPFDEERALDADAMTIAFSIGAPDAAARVSRPVSRLGWPLSVVETMLSGSVSLSTRAVGPSEFITLTPRIGLMQFDLAPGPARVLLADMTKQASAEIDERLFTFPDTYRMASRRAVELTEATLDRAPQILLQSGVRQGRVRVAVAVPPKRYVHSLQLSFGANFEDDTDQGLILPKSGSLVGVAWAEGRPQFDIAPFPAELSLPGERYRSVRRLVWRELEWSLRVPIFGDDGKVRCVVNVDGSDRLRDTRETREAFEDLTDKIGELFTPVVQRLKEAGSNG